MNGALRQYLELYDINNSLICKGSAGAMNALRPVARESLNGVRLPRKGDEGFEKTSVEEMFAPDYGINLARLNLPLDIAETFRCGVPNISTLLAIVGGDAFIPSQSLLKNTPPGVTVMSLTKAAVDHKDLVDKYYGCVAPLTSPGTALNTLLAQDGVFIHIGRNVHLEKPLQIVNILNTETPQLAFRRLLIIAEDNSSADILVCEHTQGEARNDCAISQVVEIITRPGADLRVYELEETGKTTRRYNQVYSRQHEGSSLNITAATLLNGSTRNEFNLSLEGQHCTTGLYGMAIGSDKQHIDNQTSVIHRSPRCTSNQLFRYVLDDESTGSFEGGIEVTPDAPFTEAFQSNNNILASPEARMYTKPQLLIYNDEVKCSHGATTGQLDALALFYMQTRGVPAEEARTMLMQAFMVDVIDTVRLQTLRDRMRLLVEKRFDGTLGNCSRCSLP